MSDTAMGYRATLTPDQLVIHDVPIFCECERHGVDFDKDWIDEAVKEAKIGQKDNHFAPLNILHHPMPGETPQTPIRIGRYEVTGAQGISFRGNRVKAVIADLVIDEEEFFDKIVKGKFPYRSVEIFNREIPKIDCLSLLDHEPPFLELPMLMVSEMRSASDNLAPANFSVDYDPDSRIYGNPVIACFSRGSRVQLVSEFGADVKMVSTKEKKQLNMQSEEEDKDKKKAMPDEEKRENMEELAPDPEKESEGDGESSSEKVDAVIDMAAVIDAINNQTISVGDYAEIRAAMDAVEGAIGETPAVEEAPKPAQAAVPGMESMSADNEQLAAMKIQVDALKASNEAREAKETREKDVREWMGRLEGRPLPEDIEQTITQHHINFGAKAAEEVVETLCKTVGILPDQNGAIVQQFAGKAPEVAMAYMDKGGADAVDKAAKFATEYDGLKAAGQPLSMTQERYVEINMSRFNGTAEG